MTQQISDHRPPGSPYRNRRFTTKLQKLAPAKKKIEEQRRDLQIKGGHRLTSSLKMKHNQIQFDYAEGQIVDIESFLAVLAIFKPRKKVMAKIADVSDIILGAETANFFELSRKREEEDLPPLDEDCCLSILFKSSIKTIDLVAPSSTVRRRWYMKLRQLVETAQEYGKIKSDFDLFLLEQFGKADKDGSGIISFKEALALLKTLNIEYDHKEVVEIFNKANFRKDISAHSGEDGLDIEEFVEFYHLISYTKSLQEEFFCISKGEDLMTRDAFRLFLLQTQKANPDTVDHLLDNLLERFEPLEAHKEAVAKNGHFVSWKGFRNMLISEDFEITKAETKKVNQDMTRPLTEYYVASSHNTYVPVDQLEGRSTTETYRIYLKDGCRCVELDVTDGDEPDDDPIVYHHLTLMSKMSLREIANTIAQFGFVNSPYPIIISLENNCKRLDSMRKAAAIFRDEIEDRLITGPLTGPEESQMPSPEALKGRVILKGKKLPEVKEGGPSLAELEEEKNLAKELSDLVWYCEARHFDLDTRKWKYTQMSSVEESKSCKLISKKLAQYRAFTSRHFARVYPFGLRFFSGNYNPLEHWKAGAQMVALNYQTAGNPMLLNRALFARNGNCGYVLKPETSLGRAEEVKGVRQLTVTVRVLCGFNLPGIKGCGDILDPFVEVRLFGVKKFYRVRRRTRTVDNNGLNPEWNREFSFTFDAVYLPLVFLRFRVFDKNSLFSNVLVAQRMLAIDSMEEGYRNVALNDPEDVRLDHAKLVVELKKVWSVVKSGKTKGFKMSGSGLIKQEKEKERKKKAAEVMEIESSNNHNHNHNNNNNVTPTIEVTKAE